MTTEGEFRSLIFGMKAMQNAIARVFRNDPNAVNTWYIEAHAMIADYEAMLQERFSSKEEHHDI